MSRGIAQKFRQTDVPRQQGERARLRVVSGPEIGVIYVITGARALIGRGDDCDVILFDLKSSRQHAELIADASGWTLKDLGSANGVLHNGKTVRATQLRPGDTVGVGETVLEFLNAEVGTALLRSPVRSLGQIASQQAQFEAQRRQVTSFGGGSGAGPALDGKKRLILIAGAGLAVFFLLPGEQDSKTRSARKKSVAKEERARDLASFLPGAETPTVNRAAESFFKSGFREYREKNYLRARIQFETVLQIAPNHRLAKIYLENCGQAIQEEVKFHIEQGRKGQTSGKLKEARGHYQAILRLLHRDQTNPDFIEAKEQLDAVETEIHGGAG